MGHRHLLATSFLMTAHDKSPPPCKTQIGSPPLAKKSLQNLGVLVGGGGAEIVTGQCDTFITFSVNTAMVTSYFESSGGV